MPSIVVVAATVALCAATAAATVHRLTPDGFADMYAGAPIDGVDTAGAWGYGHRHAGLWAVRFSLPFQAGQLPAFDNASDTVSPTLARFADFVLDTPDAFAVADTQGLADFPAVRVYHHGRIVIPTAPKGAELAHRPVAPQEIVPAAALQSTASLVAHLHGLVPTVFPDHATMEVRPAATVVRSRKQLDAALAAVQERQRRTGGPDARVVAVVVDMERPKHAAPALLAAFASGAMVQGRGGASVMVVDKTVARNAEWLPEGDVAPEPTTGLAPADLLPAPVTVASFGLDAAAQPRDAAFRHGVTSLPAVAEIAFEAAGPATGPKAAAAAAAAATAAGKGNKQLLSAPTKVAFPLRRLHTTAQWLKEVAEFKGGVAVLFFLRESDKFYTKQLTTARTVALDAVRSSKAVIQDQATVMKFEVFMVDAELHKDVAHGLGIKQVPGVAFLLELRDKPNKGLRIMGGELPEARKIIRFMREELFDGKGMTELDAAAVAFAPNPKDTRSSLDLSLQTHYFDVDPRRHFAAAAAPEPLLKELLAASLKTAEEEAAEAQAQAALSPKARAKAERAKAKKAAREAARKQKLQEQLEAKKKAQAERMAAKAEQSVNAKQKSKEASKQRAADAKARRAREEADGTAAKRRAAKAAAKKRADRIAALLAAKKQRGSKGAEQQQRFWGRDAERMVGAYLTEQDGALVVDDRVL